MSFEFRVMSFEFRVMSYELRVMSFEFRVMNYEFRVMNYELDKYLSLVVRIILVRIFFISSQELFSLLNSGFGI